MPGPVRLYVSSSPGLAPEREALGQVAAELPIDVGWQIKHTPGPHDDAGEALAFIDTCDLFILILGEDFAAPMGLELQIAQEAGIPVMAHRKRVMVSPSAKDVLRQSRVDWNAFDDTPEFRGRVRTDLIQAVLDRGERFGLRLDEVEALVALLGEDRDQAASGPDARRGAERGGIILGRPG